MILKPSMSMHSFECVAAGPLEERDLLLLKACLAPTAAARNAYLAWRQVADPDQPRQGEFRLLALLYHRLKEFEVDEPYAGRFKGIARLNWCRNQLINRTVVDAVDILQDAGFVPLVLKGAALAQQFYPHPGMRPMSDGDILVRPGHGVAAMQELERRGWKPKHSGPRLYFVARTLHGLDVAAPSGQTIDVHWLLHRTYPVKEAHARLWETAEPLRLLNRDLPTLSATAHLFHTCIHGNRWNNVNPSRWIADAMMIIRRAEHLDWDALLSLAHDLRADLALADALRYLLSHFQPTLPDHVLPTLDEHGRDWLQQLDQRRPKGVTADRTLTAKFCREWRRISSPTLPWWRRLTGLPGFLRNMLSPRLYRYQPAQIARRMPASVGRRFRNPKTPGPETQEHEA